jgi:hypothetical protein
MGKRIRRLGTAVVAVSIALAASAAGAEEAKPEAKAEEKGPNTGAVSVLMGMDWTSAYFFRGIQQENQGWILQPYGEITFKLLEDLGPLNALGVSIGSWNSLHGGPTGIEGGDLSQDPKMWYESDFYTRIGTTLFEDVSAGIIYTAYMSPNGRFETVQEIAFSFGYNDAKLLGPFALNPSALLAVEVKGQADAGLHKGIYLQLGVGPGTTLFEKSQYPVTLSVPLIVGLSLKDYYERIGVGGDDDTFGYFSWGLTASVPLKFIPARFGNWQAKGSINVLQLGDNLQTANQGDSMQVIGAFGLALTY